MAATQHAAAAEETSFRRARNRRLRQAVHRHKATTRQGIQERLFTLAFSGLVYPQIWEDPVVDLDALRLQAGERLVAIASGGCNVLSYLSAAPVTITAVDLNPAHVALNKLKLAALAHLPDYAAFRRFFGEADARANIDAYFTHLRPHVDETTSDYWESRDRLGRRRIGYFGSNLYRHGLLGGFIGAGHLLARLHGANPRRMLAAKTLAEQRRIFERELAPLFEKRHDPLAARPALGPVRPRHSAVAVHRAQGQRGEHGGRAARRGSSGSLATSISPTTTSPGRPSGGAMRAAARPRCRPTCNARASHALRSRAGDVAVVHASLTEHLSRQPAASLDRLRAARRPGLDDGRAAQRPVGGDRAHGAGPAPASSSAPPAEETILPGRVPDAILARFAYDARGLPAWTAKDRSSIYGGFHRYVLQG